MPYNPKLYPPNWKDIAYKVKCKAQWKCQKCGTQHRLNKGIVLTVHHKDGNPMNCHPSNLIALCQKCHLYAQKTLSGRILKEKQEEKGQLSVFK